MLALACALLSGCSMFVAKDDYRAFRATRTAEGMDARLVSLEAYARVHPDGHYIEQVEAERRSRDTETFGRGKSSRDGLEHYLRVFPDGAFAEQARARLSAIAMIEQRREHDALEAARAQQARRARERQQRRTWVTRFVDYWGGALSGLTNWGAPIAQVAADNARFSSAFARSPRPRCTKTECLKYYEAPYGIPIPGGTRQERVMQLALRLHLDAGKLVGAELLMPAHGFSRWYELENRVLVVDDDPEQRARAVAWAMEKLRAMVAGYDPQVAALPGFALPAIVSPAIGPTGEQIDASVDDPSRPSNRIGTDDKAAGTGDTGEVAAVTEPDGGPDMVVAAIQIGGDGRAVRTLPGAAEPAAAEPSAKPAAGEGEIMVLDAMSIPSRGDAAAPAVGDGAAEVAALSDAGAPAPQLEAAPEVVEGYAVGRLRIALRAAAVGAGPGYDVLWIRVHASAGAAP